MSDKIILVTNDDGIQAPGIRLLAKTAQNFGQVWVIAPDSPQSGMSHRITYFSGIEVSDYDFGIEGIKAFSVSGSPTDCVRVGALHLLPRKPDFVFSGINNGFNISGDIQYSGTAGAALEGAFLGIHSIAFSTDASGSQEVTEHYLQSLMEEFMNTLLDKNQIWNINFPGCPLSECKGILRDRKVSYDNFYNDSYTEKLLDNNKRILTVNGNRNWSGSQGTDLAAIIDKYVSVGKVNNVM